jgi:hypothetical protein
LFEAPKSITSIQSWLPLLVMLQPSLKATAGQATTAAFKGRCPTIRRPGKWIVARQGNAPRSTD